MPRARYFQYVSPIQNGPHTQDQNPTNSAVPKKGGFKPGDVPKVGTVPNEPAGGRFVLRRLGRRMEWRKR